MSHGPVMLDLQGLEVTTRERQLLKHPATGGVILFARNYESPEQVRALISEIHAIRSPALLVAVDQEGGRVQRFREGFTRLPPMASIGRQYDRNHDRALHMAREVGWLMAAELRTVGVDFSFAPVLDLNIGISEVIGDRAFHRDPKVISRLAHAWMKGCHEGGMPAIGKHFPGHGCVTADSHHDLPVDIREFADLEKQDLLPFRNMIEYGLDGIMPAHVIYQRVSDDLAGFSRFWLKEVLRKRFSFQGVVFSDDLTMAAASSAGSYALRADAALRAGCDMILVCNNQDAAFEVLQHLRDYTDPVAHSRLARMHGRKALSHQKLMLDTRYHNALRIIDELSANPELDLQLGDPTDYTMESKHD
jgi:beta-N-acetylhexosaminidase